MTRSSSSMPPIGTALTGSAGAPACGQHDSGSHDPRPVSSADFKQLAWAVVLAPLLRKRMWNVERVPRAHRNWLH
jgi:hypothetical protein